MENNNLPSKMHTLKIDRKPFLDICSGAKTAEIRRDDRGFMVGDTVLLLEHVDGSPTEREVARTISHIQRDYGLPAGMCILSYGHVPIALTGKQFDDFERMLTESPIDKNEKLLRLMERPCRWAEAEQSTGYTAVDMTTAAAEGFRDGVASVVVDLPHADQEFEYQHAGITHFDGPSYRAAVIEAIIAAGGKVKE